MSECAEILDLHAIHRAGVLRDLSALPSLQLLAADPSDPHRQAYAAWAAWTIAPEPTTRRTLTVDPRGGELRTIAAAVAVARPGDTIVLTPGRYRETIAPWLGGTAEAPLTIAAAGPGVEIVAYDPWEPSWQDEGAGCWSTVYQRLPWDRPEAWENQGSNRPSNRCEQIWCDGQLLVHHVGLPQLREAVTGFATIDDSPTGGRLWLRLAGQPQGRIERSLRRQGLCPVVRGLGHITVRGLTFIGGAAPNWTGSNWLTHDQLAVVAIRGGHHWLIEDCDIGFGDAQGIELGVGGFSPGLKRLPLVWATPGTDQPNPHFLSQEGVGGTVVRNCRVHDHAIAGIVGIGATDHLRITGCDIDRNGRKDNQGTCEEAGIKLHAARDCLIDGNRLRWNRSHGIWLDCDCERNRVTGNVLLDNDNNAFFHELSPGPAWIDSNVVHNTHSRGTGFYTHDGNGCLVANNVFRGCSTGVRIRALFHRQHNGASTRTCDNRIACNVIAGATNCAVSVMPEKPRNERNRVEGNVYWLAGQPPRLRQENTGDVGVRWEETAYGQQCGRSGGGDAVVDLNTWRACFGLDGNGAIVPASLILGNRDDESLRDRLVVAGTRLGLPAGMPVDWAPSLPGADGWLAAVVPGQGLGAPAACLQLAPDRGVICLQRNGGSRWLAWHGDALSDADPALVAAMSGSRHPDLPVLTIAAGGLAMIAANGMQSLPPAVGLSVSSSAAGHAIRVELQAVPGPYLLLLVSEKGWRCQPILVTGAMSIDAIRGDPAADGNAILVDVRNHADSDTAISAEGVIADQRASIMAIIPARGQTTLRLPLAVIDAGEATVTVQGPAGCLQQSGLVAFARAGRGEWGTTHDLNAFPGGCFPDGAWAFVLYQGTLRATWRARWDEQALHLEIRCVHARHHQLRGDPHGWHTGSAAFISVRPGGGRPGAEIGMALRSDTGEALCGFRKSIDVERYPIDPTTVLPFSIVRHGVETVYLLSLPWTVLGLDGPPPVHSDLPFSVMVSQNDTGDAYGLQWFFGIEYGHHENDEAWMGRLRIT